MGFDVAAVRAQYPALADGRAWLRGTEIVAQARRAVADLVGAPDPRGVVFGPTMTALTYRFAAVLGATWRAGDWPVHWGCVSAAARSGPV